MKRTMKIVDEATLEMKEIEVEDEAIEEMTTEEADGVAEAFRQALTCSPEEFAERYHQFQEAKRNFDEVYEPFKERLIKLHQDTPTLPKTVMIGGRAKITYVSPSTRSSIDSKRLKEEEPELAKKYTKTTNVSASLRLEQM